MLYTYHMAKLTFPLLVAFRADEKMRKAWRAAARKSHKSFSQWVRDALNRAVR